jgi:hypothetical protein
VAQLKEAHSREVKRLIRVIHCGSSKEARTARFYGYLWDTWWVITGVHGDSLERQGGSLW